MLADGPEEFSRQLREVTPKVVVLYEDNFNFLSKMCLEKMRRAACRMVTTSRRRGARVLVAGSDATDAPLPYLEAGADVVLLGEGLTALATICDRLDQDPRLPAGQLVSGLETATVIAGGDPHGSRGRPTPASAQHPGMPALDLIDVEKYRAVWQRAHGYFSLNMSTSRGCPFRCNWCAKPIWGNQYLQRPARDVAAEMSSLKRQYAPDHVWFADDIFGFRADWVEEFAKTIAASGGGIPFTIQIRPDLVSQRMSSALKAAGCREAWLGAESGSQRVLDDMDKGTTVAELFLARERLRVEGIRVGFFIQLGYIDERIEDILATRRLIESARPDEVGVSVSYPLPGTKFHERVRAQLGAKTHWQESDDLAMMFKGTYSTRFYRLVRDLIHAEVDSERPDLVAQSATYQHVKRDIQQRWDRLLASEFRYRQKATEIKPTPGAAGTGLAADIA